MGLMKRMLDHLGFESALSTSGLPQPGSNRGYRPEQLITQFMLSVWCGANRFEHGEVTRHDPVLKRLFGFKRMANFKAVMRLFNKFTQGTNESVMDALYRWMWGQSGNSRSAKNGQAFLANTLHRLGDQHVSLACRQWVWRQRFS
ncbi:MAG: hypothetical protein ABL885_04260 [Methylophilaceae bacterium]